MWCFLFRFTALFVAGSGIGLVDLGDLMRFLSAADNVDSAMVGQMAADIDSNNASLVKICAVLFSRADADTLKEVLAFDFAFLPIAACIFMYGVWESQKTWGKNRFFMLIQLPLYMAYIAAIG